MVAGLSYVDSMVQRADNDDQNVVFVDSDAGENVEIVSVAAVAGEGGKSEKNW